MHTAMSAVNDLKATRWNELEKNDPDSPHALQRSGEDSALKWLRHRNTKASRTQAGKSGEGRWGRRDGEY